jgi:hypothetical protein
VLSERHNENLCLQNDTHEAGSNLFQISVIENKKQYSLMVTAEQYTSNDKSNINMADDTRD